VFTTPIRDALSDSAAVDLAAAYGVTPEGTGHELAVAAVTLRQGESLTASELGLALSELPRHGRPAVVHVVDRLPVTTWYRPLTQQLREAGIPEPGGGGQAWYLDRSGETYRPLTAAARRRLTHPDGRSESRERETNSGADPTRPAASGPSTA
jgi:putative long chain acyl-CoA synthase